MKNIILRLFHFRWTVPVIAELYTLEGAKIVTLAVRLGISRSVLSSTLKYLIGNGFVAPNPGYGHPLRPEYILTASGQKAAVFCQELAGCTRDLGEKQLLRSKWALPVFFAVGEGEVRFSDLKTRLAPITARALSEELKKLTAAGYVSRNVIIDYPLATIYALTPKARRYVEIYKRHRKELQSLFDSRR